MWLCVAGSGANQGLPTGFQATPGEATLHETYDATESACFSPPRESPAHR